MRQFFTPATVLMGKLNYARKFALLGLLFLVAITVVLYNLYINLHQIIHNSQQELDGIAQFKQVSKAIQTIQLHRGISSALLEGSETMRVMHNAHELKVSSAFKQMEEKLPSEISSGEEFRNTRKNLKYLQNHEANLSATDSFEAHTRLIGQLQIIEEHIIDKYLLNLDPENSTYYLINIAIYKLPDLLEHLAQIRAYGTVSLVRRQADKQQKINMQRTIGKLEDSAMPLKFSIEKACYYNPGIRNMLLTASNAISDSAQRIIGIVESDILNGSSASRPEDFMMMITGEIDRDYEQIYETLLPTTETLIKARIARAENTLYTSFIIALLLFLTTAYFAIGIYLCLSDSIKSLIQSARAFASGNLSARVKIDTRDELSQIGVSFNEMSYGFNIMLEAIKQDGELRRKAGEEIRDLYNRAPCGYHSLDKNGIILKINDSELDWLGYEREEVEGKMKWADLLTQDSLQIFCEYFPILQKNGSIHDVEIEIIRKDGTMFTGLLNATAIYDSSGNYAMSRSTVFDITQRKNAEEKINRLAFYDPLTNLSNRRLLIDRLQHALAVSRRSGRYGALLFLDLDYFKIINDTQGHAMGDLLLIEVAHRLLGCVREGDSVARLGGDEFMVVLEELSSEPDEAATQAELVAEKIRNKLSQHYVLDNYESSITTSIGISMFNDQIGNLEDLLKQADLAMYHAKASGRNTIRFFDLQMQNVLDKRVSMEADLRQALSMQRFLLYYQVQIDSSGKSTGAEVLLRWEHPERGMVSPEQFIQLAEEIGLIVPIGIWVLKTACAQLNAWQQNTLTSDLTLAVNVSAKQFHQTDFVAQVRQVLLESGVKPSLLKLELTESIMLENVQTTITKMHELKQLGLSFSLDDFGTGYSSLSYLQHLPLDQIKIDQSFVRGISTDLNNAAIVQTIIAMTKALKLNVIAEGVETEEQQQLLYSYGCAHYQGYLFSKPVAIEQFDALIGMNWNKCAGNMTSAENGLKIV